MNSYTGFAILFIITLLCVACAKIPEAVAGNTLMTGSIKTSTRDNDSTATARKNTQDSSQKSKSIAGGEIDSVLSRLSEKSQQVVFVDKGSSSLSSRGLLYALEYHSSGWKAEIGPVDVVIGRNGYASPGRKREGDGMTPSGIFGITAVFGYHSSVHTAMPYRQVYKEDIWVDDPDSPDYNTMTKKGQTTADSFEYMKRDDDLYEYGVIIDYNTSPVIRGNGSAIFFHVWVNADSYTSGCVAMSRDDLVKLIGWLDPQKRPLVVLGQELTGCSARERK